MSRRVLLVLATVLLAVVGTGAVLLYVGRADARAVAGKRAVTVLVAVKKVSAGTSAGAAWRDGLLRAETMPAETVPADAVDEVGADLAALVASGDIQPGQLLLRPMLVGKLSQTSGLAIAEGKIAVSVAVSGAQRVAGYVKAGSTVAVFDTFNVMEGQGRTPAGDGLQKEHSYNQATRLLLPTAEVVAVGPEGSGGTGSGATGGAAQSGALSSGTATTADTVLVTFAVTQADAEKLIHAAQTGALYLALVTDTSRTAPGAGVDNRSVFGS